MILVRQREATPAEQAENKKLIREMIARRGPQRIEGKEWRVVIDEEFVPFGTRDEYPHRWVGTEIDFDDHKLVQLRFSKPFMGKNFKGHRTLKTDKNNMMWIPEWVLKEFRP